MIVAFRKFINSETTDSFLYDVHKWVYYCKSFHAEYTIQLLIKIYNNVVMQIVILII